ncbi:hypothetical protein MLD38_014352 [Melastoma candidum]|uniref:Uncharacterized protein n=1 Tax=Melastoma candidum TaxID=119954 RepID=A0ACB9RD19_9MYRT|nr:hypothetical protein MLD38_014352 [Melastoma candidum]
MGIQYYLFVIICVLVGSRGKKFTEAAFKLGSSLPMFTQAPNESEDAVTFDKSLKELRELDSQLHYAADYCSSAFLRTKEKRIAAENTREYICRAIVTVVDHLSHVSANLDFQVTSFSKFTEAELRMDSLKQVRSGHGGNESHDVAQRDVKKGKLNITGDCEFKAEDGVPFFLYMKTKERSAAKNVSAKCAAIERKNTMSSIVPVSDGLSKQPEAHFPFSEHQEDKRKHSQQEISKWIRH